MVPRKMHTGLNAWNAGERADRNSLKMCIMKGGARHKQNLSDFEHGMIHAAYIVYQRGDEVQVFEVLDVVGLRNCRPRRDVEQPERKMVCAYMRDRGYG